MKPACAARQSAAFMRGQCKDWEERSRREAEAAGAVVVPDIDKTPFADAMAPVYDRFVVDPKLRSLVERIRAVE